MLNFHESDTQSGSRGMDAEWLRTLDSWSLLDAMPTAIYATDATGRITYYNDAAVKLWGRVPELGSDRWCGSWRLYWPDGRVLPPEECPMAIAVREGRVVRDVEVVAERPDGTRVHFLPFPTPLWNDSGTLLGAVNVLVDVTDRSRAQEQATRLAAIIQSSDDAIVSTDLDGTVESWNDGARRLYGYEAEEVIGKSVELLLPHDRPNEEPYILDCIRRGERVDHYETVRVRKDGTLVDISLTVSPVIDGRGRIIGASKIARDISERKRAQEQEKLLLREMKHRVKNTLATVQAIAAQTLPSASRADRNAFVARLHALARSQDLLSMSEGHRARLRDVIEGSLKPFRGPDRERFSMIGSDDAWLDANRATLLTMVLHELATNAAKYGALSRAGGQVRLAWATTREVGEPSKVTLSWEEADGPPVEPPQRKGFGSVLIRRAFEGAGGTTRLEFRPQGLVFELELPL